MSTPANNDDNYLPYIIHFAQSHADFRLQELKALAELEGVAFKLDEGDYFNDNPYMKLHLLSDTDAKKLIQRAILIQSISRLWAESTTFDSLFDQIRDRSDLHAPYLQTTFKFNIHTYGQTLSVPEQVSHIERFSFLPFQGGIDLKNPDVTFTLLEDYGSPNALHRSAPGSLQRLFFGVWIGNGDRSTIWKYNLKNRGYLGTTSMDAELSLVMGNQALVRKGSWVLDPFVGTGSFLITCAHYGAFTMGADIDGRQIRGKSPECNIASNAKQYQLSHRILDSIISDLAHPSYRPHTYFSAIVTDPPYGVRAGAKKIGHNPRSLFPPTPYKPNGLPRYPQMQPYEMHELITDLLSFAATYLEMGGRLVYWLPTVPDEYDPGDVPAHPLLKLVANSEQAFGKWSRRLITMEKIAEAPGSGHVEVEVKRGTTEKSEPGHARFREKFFNELK
ncbi:S-adenosyl-L-methionine-dependent methyltransferase [Phlyctochytrium arcticum]|nr:S-adenosyl-L-methionine-dependent methyltransferase [Phlyctochytrium arcticum]